jgi:hypothetical protein
VDRNTCLLRRRAGSYIATRTGMMM